MRDNRAYATCYQPTSTDDGAQYENVNKIYEVCSTEEKITAWRFSQYLFVIQNYLE